MKLSEQEIEFQLSTLPGWKRKDEKWIEKKFRFKQFLEGIAFVNQVADLSERLIHHPMIAIDYKMVTMRLTTWNEGGLTDLDFVSAREIDGLYQKQNT
ncbi:4a-hydroxytetrahydrobiopterin dehydratase [Aneurinibacillus tyrosinisolvens]|uniref:4a-hydroxytetrahydrobiopterin dehydratase n=1 Tax=Aneurinibacillus tyrosinisolvens TaxID=1443435 RepID=UPI00063EDC94|nr:4a-hydroxytetrahydrobiopterin dehydratase [Aneurinibacillus tyrosinisolvens]